MQSERLLREAAKEIEMLRSKNQQLTEKLEMFEGMMMLAKANINQGATQGMMYPDLAWELRKEADRMELAMKEGEKAISNTQKSNL